MKSLIPPNACTWMRIGFNEISYSSWYMYLNENTIQWNILFHLMHVPEWEYDSMKSLIPPDTSTWMRIGFNEIYFSTWCMYLNKNRIKWNLLFHLIHVPEWEYDSMKSLIPPDISTWMRIWFNEISYSTWCMYLNENTIQWNLLFHRIHVPEWDTIQWNLLFHLMHVPEWDYDSMKYIIPPDISTRMRIGFNEISYSTWCMYLNENRIQWNLLFHLMHVPEWEYDLMKSLIPPDTGTWMRIGFNEISYSTWYKYLNENMIQWNLLFHLMHVPEWEYDSMK